MLRIGIACLLFVFHHSQLFSHYVFIIPAESELAVIYSDNLQPDPMINPQALKLKSCRICDDRGRWSDAKLQSSGQAGVLAAIKPGGSAASVAGDYGIVSRGEGQTIHLLYRAAYFAGPLESVQKSAPAELTVRSSEAGFQFLALVGEKPAANVNVAVWKPGAKKAIVLKTDDLGRTPAFREIGVYGAWFLHKDLVPGEFEGKKYSATHTYCTAVMHFGK